MREGLPAIRTAVESDSEQLIDILSDAFHDDPVMRWSSPRESYPRFAFGMTLPSCLPHGLTYLTVDGSGVASWLPPGVAMTPSVGVSTLWHGVSEYGLGSLARVLKLFVRLGKFHPREPHYYLFALGTRPAHQGRGVGTALMRDVIDQCDETGMQAYLESSKLANLAFYRRHGFEVIEEIQTDRDGPPMWPMLRQPR